MGFAGRRAVASAGLTVVASASASAVSAATTIATVAAPGAFSASLIRPVAARLWLAHYGRDGREPIGHLRFFGFFDDRLRCRRSVAGLHLGFCT